jgi:hypothetical protein
VEGGGARGGDMNPMAIEGLALVVGVILVLLWARDGNDD